MQWPRLSRMVLGLLAFCAAIAQADMVELSIVYPSRCPAFGAPLASECQRAQDERRTFTYSVFDGTGASCKVIADSALFRECVSELGSKGHWEVAGSRWKAPNSRFHEADPAPGNPQAVPRKDPSERSADALERIATVQTIGLVLECAAVVVIGLIWAFR